MTVTNETLSKPVGKQLIISRVLDAPRELVFKAWSEAERLAKWWGPKGADITVKNLDFRPGGRFHYVLSSEHGEMWGLFNYREIEAPERLVFVSSFSDAEGNIVPAPFFDGKWPLEIYNELTLTEADGKTTLTLQGGPINCTAEETALFESMHASMNEGFNGTFDQLVEYLASEE